MSESLESDLTQIGIDAAIDNARTEIDAGRYEIARIWLDLALTLQRDQRDQHKPRNEIVNVPVLRDGGICEAHGYSTYTAGGNTWHRATGGLCQTGPAPVPQ
jgi:hypothetical protein